MAETRLTYAKGTATPEQIDEAIQAFWTEYAAGGEARQEVADVGIDPKVLDGYDDATRRKLVTVASEAAGFGPVEIAIFIGQYVALPLASKVAVELLWQQVLRPWIDQRYGGGAIGQEKSNRSE